MLDVSNELRKHGYDVRSSDLYTRGLEVEQCDFLAVPGRRQADNVVTNPPNTLYAEFAEKALAVAKRKVAFFVRVSFLETERRSQVVAQGSGLARVYFFTNRVACPKAGLKRRKRNGKPRGGSAVFYCWCVWERGYEGPPEMHWIPEKIE